MMGLGLGLGFFSRALDVGPFTFTGDLEWIEFRLENDRDDLVAAAEVEARNALADQ